MPQQPTKTRKDETFSTNEMQSNNSNKTLDLIKTFTPKAGTPVSLLVESLVQQLCSILEPNSERSQLMYDTICGKLHQLHLIDESYQMSEFEVMRSSYQKALYQLVTVTKGDNLPIQLDSIWPLSLEEPMNGLEWSRYYREFEELEYIADGGFGQVHKARHKLDGITYAVKKVCIKSTSIKSVLTHLTEVKTLASLNHINIVPYKSCWLEPLLSNHQKDSNNHQTHPSSIEDSFMSSHMDSLNHPSRYDDTDGSFTVDFEYSENEEQEDHVIKTSTTSSTSSSEKSISRQLKVPDANSVVPHIKLKWATLFIQMKLCQKTLRQFLDDRNKYSDFREFYKQYPNFCDGDSDDEWHVNASKNIIKQVINGLGYIHSRGIVHHDIKPSNVFICEEYDGSLTVQLGDFGLACPENQRQGQHANLGGYGFGTPLYAAPEQLNGQCDKKSDIYSLGVILVELLVKCVTEMERHDLIEKIKVGKYPKDLDCNFCELIKQLLSHLPRKRPDIQELHDLINQINTTKNIRNQEMDQLKRQLSDKEDEIIILKTEFEIQNKLKELEIERKEVELNLKDAEIDKLKNVIMNLKKKKNA